MTSIIEIGGNETCRNQIDGNVDLPINKWMSGNPYVKDKDHGWSMS